MGGLLQREKTGEMDVLRPGAKDWTWVDLPDVVVTPAKKGCDPIFGSWEAHGSGSTGLGEQGPEWVGPRRERTAASRVCLPWMDGDFQLYNFKSGASYYVLCGQKREEPIHMLAFSLIVFLPHRWLL